MRSISPNMPIAILPRFNIVSTYFPLLPDKKLRQTEHWRGIEQLGERGIVAAPLQVGVLLIRATETSGGMSFLGPLWEREQVKKRLVRTL